MNTETEVSGSIEMYLAAIATLQTHEQPVPLSQLADALSHSPVSVNEMCRKLMERGWADYQPYKGVTLTSDGAVLAEQVLRRRRLWEVFLVEHLGAGFAEAEAFACQLEHATPENLARRLAAYLADPSGDRQDESISCLSSHGTRSSCFTLSSLAAGQRGRVLDVTTERVAREYLCAGGVVAGADLDVLAASSDGVLLIRSVRGQLSVCKSLADCVVVQAVGAALCTNHEEGPQ